MKKLAILSNINIDPLKNHLQKDGFSQLYFSGYNQWQSDLLDTDSGLYAFSPDYLFIYLNLEELKSDFSELSSSIESYLRHNQKTTVIISNVAFPPYSIFTYTSENDDTAIQFNSRLNDFALRNNRIKVLDFDRLISYYGYKNLFDDKFWYLGRIKLSNDGFISLSREIANVINSLEGKAKKVLIVDLDNTLWGGIVGEEGVQGIQLGYEGKGLIYLDFQKKIKQLKDTGVLLAICSKNNEQDVKEVFERNKNLLLSWDDFILHKINWNNKSENILAIADTLKLGLDSMVFIDDNPRERDMIRQQLSDVIVPEFPDDISALNRWFVMEVVYPCFAKHKLTGEDKDKAAQYKRNAQREEERKVLSYDEFIEQLGIKLTIHEADSDSLSRVSQLTQKTNQFNLTGKRYTDTEIDSMLKNKEYKIFVCEYEDKFGKEGLIGCAIVKLEQNNALIDTFLLSCRVLGRKVEYDFLSFILNDLRQNSIQSVTGIYNETPKNVLAKEFYIHSGFERVKEGVFKLIL